VCTSPPICGLDQAVVTIAPPVENGQPLVLGVDEDEEVMAQLLHLVDRVLLEHRLDCETLDLDHRRPFGRFGRRRFQVGDAWTAGSLARLNRALLVVNRPPLELVDDLVERRVEVPALALPRTGRPSITNVTSTM
jgi:hypothetical protein